MKKILTSLLSKVSSIVALFAWSRVFLSKTTSVVTIMVFDSASSEKFDRQIRFRKANNIWWLSKITLLSLGVFPILPLFLLKKLDSGLF
jgi:hypothetical protein